MNPNVFRVREGYVPRALEDSATIRVSAADIDGQAGVALFTQNRPRFSITLEGAYKLAGDLADLIDWMSGQTPAKAPQEAAQ